MTNKEQGASPVKRKKSLKKMLSKKDSAASDQMETLVSENKKLQEEKQLVERMNEELKQQLAEKDEEVFVDQANNVVLTSKTYNDLVNNTIERLSKDDIASYMSNRYKAKVISNAEYSILNRPVDESYLKNEAAQLGYTLLERQEYDYMKSKMETPDEQTVRKAVANLGLSILSTKEVDHLKNPTKSEMEKKLKALGFVVVNENANLRHSNTDSHSSSTVTPPHSKSNSISNTNINNDSNRNSGFYNLRNSSRNSLNSSRVLASRDFFEQVIKEENSNNDIVLEAGRSLGFVRLSQEQYKKLLDGQKEKVLTKTDIYAGAKDFQLTVLPNEEYRQLLKNRKKRQSMSVDDLNEYAKRFKLKLTAINKDAAESTNDSASSNSSRRSSRIFSPLNADTSYENTDSQTHHELNLERISNWCKANNYKLSSNQAFRENVEDFCRENKQKLVTEEEYEIIKNSGTISLEQVKEYVHANNLKLLPQEQYDSLKARKDGKFLVDYQKLEIVEHLKSKYPDIHITEKETILNLKKKITELEEKKITVEEAKKALPDSYHVMTDEEFEAFKSECLNSFSFEDVNNRFPEYTMIHNDDYDDLNTKLDKAVILSQKKKSLEEINELLEKDYSNYKVIEQSKLSEMIETAKESKAPIISKPKTLEEIEHELNEISPEHMVVNREEMFKALEDNTMAYEDLVNVIDTQYPDLVLVPRDTLEKHEISMKQLKEEINVENERQIREISAEYEELISNLKSDFLGLKSLDNLQEIIETEFPEKTVVDKKALQASTNLNIHSIADIEEILSNKYPDSTIVEKSEYKGSLEELARSIQENELLIQEVQSYKEKVDILEQKISNIDEVTNHVQENFPGSTIVSDKEYSVMSENLSNIIQEHEVALDKLNQSNAKHEALVAKVNNLSQMKELIAEKHPSHEIIPADEEALKEHVLIHHPDLFADNSKQLDELTNDYEEALELLAVEKSKLDNVDELKKVIEEKHPDMSIVSSKQLEELSNNYEEAIQSLAIEKSNLDNIDDLKRVIEEKHPDISVVNSKNLEELTNNYEEALELLAVEKSKLDDINELKRVIEEKHPDKELVSKDELQVLSEPKSAPIDSKETSSFNAVTDEDLKNPEFVKLTANKIGLDVISPADMAEMSNHFAETGKQQILYNELKSIAEVKYNAKVLTHEELETLNKKPELDLNLLTETAEEYGLVLMSNEEVEELKSKNLSQNSAEKELKLEDIGELATKNGLAVIPVDKFDDYQNLDLNREAKKNNMVLLSTEEYTNLTNNQSMMNDSNYNNTHANLNDLSEELQDVDNSGVRDEFDFHHSQQVADDYDLEEPNEYKKASLNNIEDDYTSLSKVTTQESKVVLTKNMYKELLERPEMTKELLVQKARDYDMIAIDLQHFAEITKANMNHDMSLQDAMLFLQDQGYLSIPAKEYENLANPSIDDVATLAYNKWNMVLVERNNSLVTRNQQDKRMMSANGSRHASLIQIQPSISHSGNNTYSNDTSFNNATLESENDKENGPYLFQPFQHQRKRSLLVNQQEVNLVEEAKKQHMLLIPENMYLKDLHQIPPLNAADKDNGLLLVERSQLEELIMNERRRPIESPSEMSALTHDTEVKTDESRGKFQNEKIIISLTQTVIGEYLYKYYNRFGNMGHKPRHERYFWIHPYTMTLYWSLKNPSKDGKNASSDSGSNHKTKGVGIVGVEVVDDPNPYPPGLYNKSIVILTSDGKNVKITCPTQQRHKVWLRSLKYLENAAHSKENEGLSIGNMKNFSGFETRGNKRLSFSGIRNPSNSYEAYGNNRITPEIEQHPKFFVNSLK